MPHFVQTHCLLDLGQADDYWIALHQHITNTQNNGIKDYCIHTQDILQGTQLTIKVTLELLRVHICISAV